MVLSFVCALTHHPHFSSSSSPFKTVVTDTGRPPFFPPFFRIAHLSPSLSLYDRNPMFSMYAQTLGSLLSYAIASCHHPSSASSVMVVFCCAQSKAEHKENLNASTSLVAKHGTDKFLSSNRYHPVATNVDPKSPYLTFENVTMVSSYNQSRDSGVSASSEEHGPRLTPGAEPSMYGG